MCKNRILGPPAVYSTVVTKYSSAFSYDQVQQKKLSLFVGLFQF
jgi:hypothetical protein